MRYEVPEMMLALIVLSIAICTTVHVCTTAQGITMSYAQQSAGGIVGITDTVSAGKDATATTVTTMDPMNGNLYQVDKRCSSGRISVEKQISAEGRSLYDSTKCVGDMSAATSVMASSKGVQCRKSLSAEGSAAYTQEGSTPAGGAGLGGAVIDGRISSEQVFNLDDSAVAGQVTSIRGSDGGVKAGSSSGQGVAAMEATFSGRARMDVGMVSGDGKLSGYTAVNGKDCFGGEGGEIPQDAGMRVDGCYIAPGEKDLGTFSFDAVRFSKPVSPAGSSGIEGCAVSKAARQSPSAYLLAGWRLNSKVLTGKDPNVQLYLNTNKDFGKSGLKAAAAIDAIEGASQTWDGAAGKQELFKNTVKTINLKNGDAKDKMCVHSFENIDDGSYCLAYGRTWYSGRAGGYASVTECDVVYNLQYGWTTDSKKASWAKLDFESVALHELGHHVGLEDIYGDSRFKKDTNQVMHYYNGVKRTLGEGDKAGVKALYG